MGSYEKMDSLMKESSPMEEVLLSTFNVIPGC